MGLRVTWEVLGGDCRELLRTLPAESVQCVVTSPPYWGLRDYGIGPDALGLEPTPDLYVEHLVQVFQGVRRVIRKDGTLWLNMGDCYASGNRGENTGNSDVMAYAPKTNYQSQANRRMDRGMGLKPKDLVGMPWRVAFALQADGWWLRSEIIWSKPNPMPESVTDRPTRAHEQVFLLTKSARYFYDADAVREPLTDWSLSALAGRWHRQSDSKEYAPRGDDLHDAGANYATGINPAGRNLRSVWTIATEQFREAHFATFPKKLVEPCVKAGTSEKGCCSECGAPWMRVVHSELAPVGDRVPPPNKGNVRAGGDANKAAHLTSDGWIPNRDRLNTTLGWQPSCSHSLDPIPCTVLDPFCGSGTVGVVARGHGRSFIGIELSETYADMAHRRISGMKRGLDEDGTPLWEQETMFS